jgi:hypothetical protein
MPVTGLFIAVPTTRADIKAITATSLIGIVKALDQRGIENATRLQGFADIVTSRNVLASMLLTMPSMSHVLFIDSDMEVKPATVLKMIEADVDLIACACPQRSDPITFVVKHGPSLKVANGITEVDETGMAVCMISKAALTKLVPTVRHAKAPSDRFPAHYGFFDQIIAGDDLMTEDLSFCRRYRKAGGTIHCLIDHDIGHIGDRTWRGNYLEALKARVKPLT